MKQIVGIDEAGYSPLLGPLVVSAAAFEVLDIPQNWWQALGIPRACDDQSGFSLPAVDDSKKLYTPSNGVGRLERGVLAFLSVAGYRPASLRELLACVDARVDLDAYPWYRDTDITLPRVTVPFDIQNHAGELRTALDRIGMRFAGFRSAPLAAGDFNRQVRLTSNKALTLLNTTLRLVERHLNPVNHTIFYIDKQGARNAYRDLIAQYFFGSAVDSTIEGKVLSTCRLSREGCRAELNFCLSGDATHLPIALASMLSKYIRELCMEIFNRYWQALDPNVPRTSGYRNDCWAFLKAVEPLPQYQQADKSLLTREK